jgi:hypothetical protein
MGWQNHSAARSKPQSGSPIQQTTTAPIAFDAQLNSNYLFHSMACSFQTFSTNHVSDPLYIN